MQKYRFYSKLDTPTSYTTEPNGKYIFNEIPIHVPFWDNKSSLVGSTIILLYEQKFG